MAHHSQPSRAGSRHYWVPATLFACAVVLVFNPFPYTSVVSDLVSVPESAIDPTPVRQPHLLPEYRAGVFTYRCSECHKIIDSPAETTRTLTQHTEIQLEHGINTRCFNCHHPTNRDAFVDDYGREIPWDQPPELCGKCHGPVYRDWQHGSHGRTNGYWDQAKGERTLRRCIECHDPHRPSFPSLAPAPGPQTLRMGPQNLVAPHAAHDPLRLSGQTRSRDAVVAPAGVH